LYNQLGWGDRDAPCLCPSNYNTTLDIFNPWVKAAEAHHEYGLDPIAEPSHGAYEVIILAVAHDKFRHMGAEIIWVLGKLDHVFYELKYVLRPEQADLRL